MSAHSGEGDHSFRRMATTYSDPWRPGWRGCVVAAARRSRSPSHQQLLLSATSAVEAREVYVAGLLHRLRAPGGYPFPAGSHCRAIGFASPGAGNTTPCQEYNQCTLLAALHESEPVKVFGRLHDDPIHTRRGQAYEKRQGTKSREVGRLRRNAL